MLTQPGGCAKSQDDCKKRQLACCKESPSPWGARNCTGWLQNKPQQPIQLEPPALYASAAAEIIIDVTPFCCLLAVQSLPVQQVQLGT